MVDNELPYLSIIAEVKQDRDKNLTQQELKKLFSLYTEHLVE